MLILELFNAVCSEVYMVSKVYFILVKTGCTAIAVSTTDNKQMVKDKDVKPQPQYITNLPFRVSADLSSNILKCRYIMVSRSNQ